ncbi:bidirectional sugar transporter SWEET6b-like isoform X2 [Dioscorea cayenensis subsp. rotundata]|uniref:Bidirectional sugar transporter SWEET n=1 Tax=Dioscorea cayennensis subsp. rotundata TaxID=55577 RepID=A0AB40CU86_DIOCR|nr:bidirectional sugar transporter SWEET6b-like isoform X2 [Dioscorea cayenensis subsp. rotundata]
MNANCHTFKQTSFKAVLISFFFLFLLSIYTPLLSHFKLHLLFILVILLAMVSSDAIRSAVGILGNVIALVLFLSPVPTFVRICKNKSVEQFSPIPYLATLLNCMMWVVYGLPLVHPKSMLVITINGAGTVIELTYILLFLIYSNGKQRLKRLVIQTKSVEFMPLFLSLASFFNGLCWTTYALIRFDLYITIPNSLGVIFAVGQLLLYVLYYKSTKKQKEERKKKGEIGLAEVVVANGDSNKVSEWANN